MFPFLFSLHCAQGHIDRSSPCSYYSTFLTLCYLSVWGCHKLKCKETLISHGREKLWNVNQESFFFSQMHQSRQKKMAKSQCMLSQPLWNVLPNLWTLCSFIHLHRHHALKSPFLPLTLTSLQIPHKVLRPPWSIHQVPLVRPTTQI